MDKIISIDLKADFGFLKKPDTNDPIYLTFNMLHKPALLGILGAILGLRGFSEATKKEKGDKKKVDNTGINKEAYLPDYYRKLKDLKIGIKPLNDESGNFEKTIIKYNNAVGYANLDGGNLIIIEQTLISPSYRCYIHVSNENDIQNRLYDYLKTFRAEYLPYLGKNDFSLWWENFQEYEFVSLNILENNFKLSSIFIKEDAIKNARIKEPAFKPFMTSSSGKFIYFENLPTAYDVNLMQYEYQSFTYTDWELKQSFKLNNLYQLNNNEIIQLF